MHFMDAAEKLLSLGGLLAQFSLMDVFADLYAALDVSTAAK
jgi:hypothetical protein